MKDISEQGAVLLECGHCWYLPNQQITFNTQKFIELTVLVKTAWNSSPQHTITELANTEKRLKGTQWTVSIIFTAFGGVIRSALFDIAVYRYAWLFYRVVMKGINIKIRNIHHIFKLGMIPPVLLYLLSWQLNKNPFNIGLQFYSVK
mgnify:CR=1 FL=1